MADQISPFLPPNLSKWKKNNNVYIKRKRNPFGMKVMKYTSIISDVLSSDPNQMDLE